MGRRRALGPLSVGGPVHVPPGQASANTCCGGGLSTLSYVCLDRYRPTHPPTARKVAVHIVRMTKLPVRRSGHVAVVSSAQRSVLPMHTAAPSHAHRAHSATHSIGRMPAHRPPNLRFRTPSSPQPETVGRSRHNCRVGARRPEGGASL